MDKHVGTLFDVPIVSVIQTDGADGIGRKLIKEIENHNPHDVIANCRRFIRGEPFERMVLWFRGWKGTVDKGLDSLFSMFGRWRIAPTTVEVVALPLGVLTEKYKKYPETLIERKTVRGSSEHRKINTVHFDIESCEELDDTEIFQRLKLTVSIAATNMNLFDRNSKIKRTRLWGKFCRCSASCGWRWTANGRRSSWGWNGTCR